MPSYEIVTDFERPDPSLIERANHQYFCMVGCAVGPRYVMDPGIKPMDINWRICGPAFTVRPEETDDVLMGQIAGKYVKPGDVVIIDAAGDKRAAAIGGSMCNGLKESGAVGIVVDGYVLTAEVIRKREGIPVFCRGTVSRAATYNGPGWLNVPVICGGVIVNPGDLIVGDEDGVVVVPRAQVEDVIAEVAGNPSKDSGRPLDGNIPPREPQAGSYYQRCGAEDKVAALEGMTIK